MNDDVLHISSAIRAALLCQAAYGRTPYPISPAGTILTMIDGMEFYPAVDVQCLVIREIDRLTFAFRGTDDARKFLSDADILFHPVGAGLKVHAGAWRLLDAIWPGLALEAERSLVPIYACGHSLGGMLARLFTLRLARERNIKVTQSMTFGEPRSLNRAAANYYNTLGIPTWRFVDAADIVTRVPWRFGLYQHVGRSSFIDQTGQITFDEPWTAHLLPDLVEIIQGIFRRKNAPIYDHGIQRYIAALTKYRLRIEV